MPMNRDLYPDNWDEIALQVKEEAGWKCEECGRQCYRPGEKCPDKRNVLTVSHQNHDPADCRRENLKALCSGCHLRYDAKHHQETRRRNMKAKEIERNYTTRELTDMEASDVGCIKHQARDLALMVNDRCPDGREKSLALTKLEEATMWATAAIARSEGGRR